MSYYGMTFPEYWTGLTGRAIQARGGKDATILGLYVTSARRANMIGLYHLPLREIADHTPLTEEEILAAFHVLATEDFAYYDPKTEVVWVRQMARFRLGLGDDRPQLEPGDKRVAGARRLYEGLPANPWLFAFFQLYKSSLLLKKRRGAPTSPLVAPLLGWKGLGSGDKPVQQINRSSEERSEKITGAPRRHFSTPVENPSWAQYLRVAHDAIDRSHDHDHSDSLSNISEWAKTLCAQRGFPYDGESVRKAIDAALKTREKREAATA